MLILLHRIIAFEIILQDLQKKGTPKALAWFFASVVTSTMAANLQLLEFSTASAFFFDNVSPDKTSINFCHKLPNSQWLRSKVVTLLINVRWTASLQPLYFLSHSADDIAGLKHRSLAHLVSNSSGAGKASIWRPER